MTTEEAIKELTGLAEYLDKHVTAMGGESISMAISALKNQQNGGWISVEDGLPKRSGRYLCVVENIKRGKVVQQIQLVDFYADNPYAEHCWDCDLEVVTHWRYPPEPPKKEEEK